MVEEYERYCRPLLVDHLKALSLDVTYERAQGDRLWQRRGTRVVEILDFVGGYGSGLFGHSHPALVAEATRLLHKHVPSHAQGSNRTGAGCLAEALSMRLGAEYIAIFTNSGAETVEAALKHAHLDTCKSTFWAAEGAYHGKTTGAIQLSSRHGLEFKHWGPPVQFLNPDDPSNWEALRRDGTDCAAVFVEPIQGEGGVRPLSTRFLNWLRETCTALDTPLVADEIQTGMGRTGHFLASDPLQLHPDYVCLSKALGGGLAKIGALLIRKERFVDNFALSHTSTFAEDEWSSRIALRALRLLEEDDLLPRCAAAGNYLLRNLENLRASFPDEIRDIRGRGLMIGVELADFSESPSNMIRVFAKQGYLGWIASAYLLNVHGIRVAPTLGHPNTLRVQPSAYVSPADLDRFVEALAEFCRVIQRHDIAHLIGLSTAASTTPATSTYAKFSSRREEPRTTARVGFVAHLIAAQDAILIDPALQAIPAPALAEYLERTARLVGPTVFDQVNVQSITGSEVHLSFIGLNLTSRQIVRARDDNDVQWIINRINDALLLARSIGCGIVGLGGYTSILTGNCLKAEGHGMALTSGNALTVGMSVRAVERAAAQHGIALGDATLGIVGAPGNIAECYARMMAKRVKKLILVVRNPSSLRVSALVRTLYRDSPRLVVETSKSVDALRNCSLIVAASASGGGLIMPHHLGHPPVVICDIAVPSDVAGSVRSERPDVEVIKGGVVRLPRNPDFKIGGIPLEPGYAFACMAETLLMGLARVTSHGSYGRIGAERVEWALSLADRHGFTLGRSRQEQSY